jgi:catechol 2,3-dioxygenase-like lactoylglutathione lyase family enzyme
MALDIAGSLQGVQHFGLTVDDLDRSVEFYVEVLGGKLALSGDGFSGEELYHTLFQKDYLDAARRGIDPRTLGVVDLRDGSRAVLDVRIISFGNATVELLRVRAVGGVGMVPTGVGHYNVGHLCFDVREDVDLNEFALALEAECQRRGISVGCNRIVRVNSEAERRAADTRFAANKFWADPKYPVPGRTDEGFGDFHGLGFVYCKGPNGEQIEFCQLKNEVKARVAESQRQYLAAKRS